MAKGGKGRNEKITRVKLSVVSHPVICIVSIKVVLSKGVITR